MPSPSPHDPTASRTTHRIAIRCGVPLLAALLLLLPWALGGCGGDGDDGAPRPVPGAPPAPTDTLLVVDGVTVTFADLAPPIDYLERLAPEFSLGHRAQKVLSEYTLPLLFARREFAAERAAQLELARTVRAACDNAEELETLSEGRMRRRAVVSRGDVDMPVAEFLFDPIHAGGVSDPIEVPAGWVLAGAFDLTQNRVAVQDVCDALQVGFMTHHANEWRQWLQQLPVRLADKVTFVHPEFRSSMPPWMKLP
ncbi:MAG: hypothetical protein AB7O97_23855 [Planctomycetota bacterium]